MVGFVPGAGGGEVRNQLLAARRGTSIFCTVRRVLVVDDEENLRLVLRTLLRRNGYEVETAGSGEDALGMVESFGPDFVITDVRMPKMGGLDLLATLKAKGSDATVIVMSAYGNTDMALEAMKGGAYDYIQKPFKPDEVVLTLRKAEERELLRRENRALARGDPQREQVRRHPRQEPQDAGDLPDNLEDRGVQDHGARDR